MCYRIGDLFIYIEPCLDFETKFNVLLDPILSVLSYVLLNAYIVYKNLEYLNYYYLQYWLSQFNLLQLQICSFQFETEAEGGKLRRDVLAAGSVGSGPAVPGIVSLLSGQEEMFAFRRAVSI